MSRAHRPVRAHHQRGFTLVEFMVASLLSLLCVLAVTYVYVDIKRTFIGQTSMTALLENQRLALLSLTNTVQMAGHMTEPQGARTITEVFAADSRFKAGQYILGEESSLSVRYETADSDDIQTCIGSSNHSGAPQVFTNTYRLNDKGELVCKVDGGAEISIARNIRSFAVFFGLDTSDSGSVNLYASSENIAPAMWNNVRSVRLEIQFASDAAFGKPSAVHPVIIQNINLMRTYGQLQK